MSETVHDARAITTFIYNHGHILSLTRKKCSELVRPATTRFATNYIALKSMLDNKVGLRATFTSQGWEDCPERRTSTGRKVEDLINSSRFWDGCERVVAVMEPIVLVLRMVDGDKKPTMPSIYAAVTLLKEKVELAAAGTRKGNKYGKIVEDRKREHFSHLIHRAGM